jgi:hypothetical protein
MSTNFHLLNVPTHAKDRRLDLPVFPASTDIVLSLEIPNFLSDSECEHVKDLARKCGLKESVAGFEEQAYKGEIEDALRQSGIYRHDSNFSMQKVMFNERS